MNTQPNQPTGKRRGGLFKTLLKVGLGAAVVLIAAFAFLAYNFFHTTPQGLYHRTWQMAPEFAYDATAIKDWPSYEHKYDAQIPTDADAIKYANEMLSSLNDPYTRLEDPAEVAKDQEGMSGQFTGIGISLRVKSDANHQIQKDADGNPLAETDADGNPIIKDVRDGGPARAAGLQNGDAITTVNGQSVKNIALEGLIEKIRGQAGTQVTLGIRRGGRDIAPVTITRASFNVPAVTTKSLPDNIGYIRLESFEQSDGHEEMAAALKQFANSRALIVDLRGNPGGQVDQAIKISSLFLEQGTIVSIRQRVPFGGHETTTYKLTANELLTHSVDSTKADSATSTPDSRLANLSGQKPVIILVDGGSASAAEMFTGALKDNGRAIVIGERTYGKGIGQSIIPMPNGTRLRVTSLRYFTPNGTWLGDAGITISSGIHPDVEVKAVRGLEMGAANDNQLAAALAQLSSQP